MKPAISIIVPIYNVEEYLETCLESILEQTFSDFELILVNDGSTDKCGEICDYYAETDSRTKVIHKQNGGVSSARNKGLEVSNGKYIAFVDPDDTIEQNMYEIMYKKSIVHNADIVVCPIKTIDLINNTNRRSEIWENTDILDRTEIKIQIIPSILSNKDLSLISSVNKLYRKSLFYTNNIKFDEDKHHSEDARLNFKLLTLIESLIYVEEPLYNYYMRKRDSLTRIFREDLYDYIVDNKEFLIDISKVYGYEIFIKSIRNHFSKVTLSYIHEVVNSTILITNKYRILSSILNDKEFYKDLLKYKSPSIYYMSIKIICLLKNEKLLIRFIKAKSEFQYFVKNNIVGIIKKISNF
ncbi:hypothetical protein CWR48_01445 [Oceanobacillus arenosus]|uniref:Glycosyltransferase 2-like domain-containing protein n=1 Tax=Oceanobacillus arenosus TaxID=1229153 RepID=A0A3D8Q2Z3_9BACI|nr:glycosyltransferase [Oceanobacillus arenosus]RDW22397.1 hypothetical protein CWR48_01445 [Oceanobacillus arenosus]